MRATSQIRITMLLTATAVGLTGCLAGPGFLKQQGNASLVNDSSKINATVLSSENGAVTGAISGGSGDTQVLAAAAGSGIDGASVVFPPGALAVDATITVEEGADLVNDVMAAELGLGEDVAAASGAVVVAASDDIDAVTPFTVSISMDGSGLVEIDRTKIIVIFKIKKPGLGFFSGIIPNHLLTFEGDLVKFETKNFGSFQAVSTSMVITEFKEVEAAAPIITKREEIALPEPLNFNVVSSTSTSVSLSWSNGGGTTAGFAIVFAPDRAPFTCAGATMTSDDPNKASGQIDNLLPDRNYQFRLCAVDATGRQSAGVVTQGKTSPAPLRPGAFQILTNPKPANLPVYVWSSNDFKVGFTRSSNAASYEAFFATDVQCADRVATVPAASVYPDFSAPNMAGVDTDVTGFAEGGVYFFCMEAVNGVGRTLATPFQFEMDRSEAHINYTKKTIPQAGDPTFSHVYAQIRSRMPERKVVASDAHASAQMISPVSSLTMDMSGNVIMSYGRRTAATPADQKMELVKVDRDANGALRSTLIVDMGSGSWTYGQTSSVVTLDDGSISLIGYKTDNANNLFFDYREPAGTFVTVENFVPPNVGVAVESVANTDMVHSLYQIHDTTPGPSRIYFERSSNYSPTFAPSPSLLPLSGPSGPCIGASYMAPAIAMNADHAAYGYVCRNATNCTLVVDYRTTTAGVINASTTKQFTFPLGTSANCADTPENARFLKPSLAFAPNGELHVAFTTRATATSGALKYFRIEDNATNTSVPENMATIASNVVGAPQLAVDDMNRAYVFWLTQGVTFYNLMMSTNNSQPFGGTLQMPPIQIDNNVTGIGSAAITGVPGRSEWP